MNIKAVLSIAAIATLTACGSGEDLPTATTAPVYLPVADGVRCSAIDLSKVPTGYCANPDAVIHAGKPNSKGVVSAQADVATKE